MPDPTIKPTEDAQLEEDVLHALNADPHVIAAHIGVMVNAGVVTLTGHVESLADKLAAEKSASRARGVRGIAEEIQLQLPSVSHQSDDQIAIGALNCLSWTTLVPQKAIKVKVERGWITLTGEVCSDDQKAAAEQIVHQLYGVTGVTNRIRVASQTENGNAGVG